MSVNKAKNTAAQISIIMPLYNKENLVLSSIVSVQAQTFCDWELVVIDDGSTDTGPEQVAAIDDKRIRLVRQANAGVSAARNRGIALAQCDLVAFLDADDVWLPGFLESVVALAHDFPAAQWFATGYEKHDTQGLITPVRLNGLAPGFTRGLLSPYFVVAMQSEPPVWTSATAVKRSAINAIGGFPVGVKSGEDLLTWARLAVQYPLAYDSRCQSVFRISGVERKPDPAQAVTKALTRLLADHPATPGLRAYLGLWCRMQAVMALRFNDNALARRCAWQAFLYGPRQWRNGYTLLLAWLPWALRQRLDRFLRRLAGG